MKPRHPAAGTYPGPVFWTGSFLKKTPVWTGKNFYENFSIMTCLWGGGCGRIGVTFKVFIYFFMYFHAHCLKIKLNY